MDSYNVNYLNLKYKIKEKIFIEGKNFIERGKAD